MKIPLEPWLVGLSLLERHPVGGKLAGLIPGQGTSRLWVKLVLFHVVFLKVADPISTTEQAHLPSAGANGRHTCKVYV